jgi:histidinol phosphatase-like enzyme
MFKKCEADDKEIKFKQGYYVGDKMKDLKAAMNVGARPVLVRTGYGAETEKELNKWTYRKIKQRTIIFDDLAQFVESLA